MAKKKVSEVMVKIRKLLADKKLVMGLDRTLKNLKQNKLSLIYFASNCSEIILEKLEKYCELSNVKIEKLKMPGDELGTVCKKPFSISVLGVLKSK